MKRKKFLLNENIILTYNTGINFVNYFLNLNLAVLNPEI